MARNTQYYLEQQRAEYVVFIVDYSSFKFLIERTTFHQFICISILEVNSLVYAHPRRKKIFKKGKNLITFCNFKYPNRTKSLNIFILALKRLKMSKPKLSLIYCCSTEFFFLI